MTIARDAAWQSALEYAPLNIPANQQLFIAARDQQVTTFGKSFLYPGFWLSTLICILRVFEFGSVSSKIKKLNT